MTIVKQVPAGLLKALGLQKGDFMYVKDESPGKFTIEITSSAAQNELQRTLSHRQKALAKFAVGAGLLEASAQQKLDHARYKFLRAKHLK